MAIIRLSSIETQLVVLTWMVGTMAALIATIGGPMLWLLLRIACKVGAL